jgi:iron complex outermembrane receptor protein
MRLFSRLLLVLLFSFLQNNLPAQVIPARPKKNGLLSGSLSGNISDNKLHGALAKATIYIPDLQLSTLADEAGHYSFKLLPGGRFLVAVSYVGYKTLSRFITINGTTTENFELADEAVEGNAVVVTGTSKATQIRRNPVPIVAVTHNYITQNLSTNIIDAISKVPGVNALTTGPNVSKPFIRGLGYNRILTLYNGVRQEGQQWGDEHGIEVDQYDVDRIEVIKGPASLSYGSDALAGVVNLIPTPSASEGKLTGDIIAEYQSNNGLFGGSAMLGGARNEIEWMGRITHKAATNYQNKYDGRVFNTAFRETDASLALGIHRKWGFSHLSFSVYDDIQEIPDGSRDSATRKFTQHVTEADSVRPIVSNKALRSYTITSLHQHVQHFRAYSTNSFNIGNSRLALNLGFQRSVRREFNHPESPFQDIAGLYLQLNTFSYDLNYHLQEFDGWNLTFGINGMYQDNNVEKGTEFIIPSYHQFDLGPFALLKKTFSKLDIAGGIRYDTRSFSNNALYVGTDPYTDLPKPVYGSDTSGASNPFFNYKHNFSGASGSIGATYNFSDHISVKANVSRGFRAPNIAEISANGPHPGTNIYQIGNGNLKPEFSLQEDIGFEFNTKYAAINLSVFNNTISNYIFNQRLLNAAGTDSVIVPNNQTYKFRQGKANLYGGELSIDVHPVKALHFENSISVVYGINKNIPANLKTDSNKFVPFIPPLHGVSEIRYGFENKQHHFINGFVKAQVAYYGKQDRVYLADNTETATTGYALFNAGIGTGVTNRKGKIIFNVSVMANNLFDAAYQDHLSRLKYFEFYKNSPSGHYGIYNMGRNVAFKINFPLDFSIIK